MKLKCLGFGRIIYVKPNATTKHINAIKKIYPLATIVIKKEKEND